MKYYIPVYNLSKLESLVEKLSKKTTVNFSYDMSDLQVECLQVSSTEKYRYYTVAVDLDVDYKLGDYEVVAEIEHTENGNIIRQINYKYEIPVSYRTSDPYCEHCHTNRLRKNTFLLVDKAGNFKQVGKSCLNEYTGIDSLKLVQLTSSLSFLLSDKSYVNDPEFLELVRNSRFEELNELANRFYQVLLNHGYAKGNPFYYLDDYSYEKKFDVEIKKLLDVVNTSWYNDNNDYCHNCKVVLGLEYVEYKHWTILISYLNSAMKYLQSKNINNEYLGKVGDRITFKVKTLKKLWAQNNPYHYSHYNTSTIFTYRIITETDNVVIWKTEAFVDTDMTIKATIKNLNIYRDEKQTVVTRGSIIPEPADSCHDIIDTFMDYIEYDKPLPESWN